MVVAVYIAFMFVVRVLGTKHGRANGTGEMFDMVFAVKSCDIRASECTAAFVAQEVESSEVVCLT